MKNFFTSLFALALLATCSAQPAMAGWGTKTDEGSTRDGQAAQATAAMTKEAWAQVGAPRITHFTELRTAKWLYELRDEPNYRTYTYVLSMTGEFIKVCDSVGYGQNASVQYTNPERLVHEDSYNGGYGAEFTKQPEPNGLFMPEGLSATFVLCIHEDDVKAVYAEPEIITSPFPLPVE